MKRILLVCAIALAATRAAAVPVVCGAGTIDFTATSYDPLVPLTTFNVGQPVTLTAQPVGIAPSAFEWTIDPPHIKDYEERIGTTMTGAFAWSTTPLAPADLGNAAVTFYWKPSPSQIDPLNGGPVMRNVLLKVTVGMIDCTVSQTFNVERDAADVDKQAEDFYTRNHKAPMEMDPTKGRVLDDHIEWHTIFGTRLLTFLPWHHEFLGRFNNWRAEFGYPQTISWYPGDPIPTGIDIDFSPRGMFPYFPGANRIPTRFTLAGAAGGLPKRLADYATLDDFSNALEGSWHGQVHCAIGGIMCTFSSPMDPIFFRWHGIIDRLYENYCTIKSLACAGVTMPASDMWMADNANDLAAGGTEPSTGTLWMSPSIWNRTMPAPCTPADPLATVARTCGSAADHENPIASVANYLYATIRNDRPAAQDVKYVEVAVYIANASTGLSWPMSFGGDPDGALPETRQFLTVNVPAGQVTDIGPVPWTPPVPAPSDHWCVYVRLLSEQAPIGIAETANIAANVQASNNLIWRNLHIVINSTDSATFTVRNPERAARHALRIDVPEKLFTTGHVRLLVPSAVAAKWSGLEGVKASGRVQQERTPMPVIAPPGKNISKRERELRASIAKVQAEVKECARGTKGTDAKSERDFIDVITQLEKLHRACRRNSDALAAFTLTSPRASINVPLAAGEAVPVTIEFSSDVPERVDYPVLVSQELDGRVVGGMTYIVRTGTH